MMRSKQFVLKTIAVFLSINILSQVLGPTAVWALTSGPTTPEVSSFEPIDTTDMVNLATGDLTYNMPLLNVPGPEGGYPVSLAYHAGIMPAQDASWVGLGWNLNPGCINRTPNNFADDYNGGYPGFEGDAISDVWDYWSGTQTTEYTLGVGVTFDGIYSVGVNIGIQQSSYKGTCGVFGFQAGFGFEDSQLGLGVGFQADGWGDASGSLFAGSNLMKGNSATGMGMQLAVGSQGGQSFADISLVGNMTQSSMGVDLSSSGTKFYATPSSMFIGKDSHLGQISTDISGMNLFIPIEDFYVSLGYKYIRYYSSTTQNTGLYGVLNSMTGYQYAANPSLYPNTNGDPDGQGSTYDCVVLHDPEAGMSEQLDINWTSNASIPSYDSYTVMGQGIYGAIEPVVLDNGSLWRADYLDANGALHLQSAFPRPFTKGKHFFRFINDFSNSHTVDLTSVSFVFSNNDAHYSPLLSNQDLAYSVLNLDSRGYVKQYYPTGSTTYSPPGSTAPVTIPSSVFNYMYGSSVSSWPANTVSAARFAGSKHVEYYTNAEITAGTARMNGFIDSPDMLVNGVPVPDRTSKVFGARAYNTAYNLTANIGGYTVTNEKGVSYHYALPVYAFGFGQTQQSTVVAGGNGIYKRTVETFAPYAYTWLLTAVTGPDFVDRNANGIADGADWGYWVTFDYGKFQDNAGYRTPETGTTTDVDGSTIVSSGGKQMYYLDAISTRSHTALFIKDVRYDGKGTEGFDYNSLSTVNVGSEIFPATNTLKLSEIVLIDNNLLSNVYNVYNSSNETLGGFKNIGPSTCGTTGAHTTSNCDCQYQSYSGVTDQSNINLTMSLTGYILQSLYPNVLDMGDCNVTASTNLTGSQTTISALNLLRYYAQKDIRLSYNYNTCTNTTNSFAANGNAPLGKLSLQCISFFGNNQSQLSNGNQLLPSTNFVYELVNPLQGSITFTSVPNPTNTSSAVCTISSPSTAFNIGDILSFGPSSFYYGTILSGSMASGYQMLVFGPNGTIGLSTTTSYSASQTKNPPYMQNMVDLWGFFKSDYNSGNLVSNKTNATTYVSAQGVDCWSLRQIQTSTGANINLSYQSDDYDDVVLENYITYNINPNYLRGSYNATTGSFTPISNINNTPSLYPQYNGPMYYSFTISDNLQQALSTFIHPNDKIKIVAAIAYLYNPNPFFVSNVELDVINVSGNSIIVYDPSNQLFPPNAYTLSNYPAYSTVPAGGNPKGTNVDGIMIPNGTNYNVNPGCQSLLLGAFLVPDRTSQNFVYGGGVRASIISVTDGSTIRSSNYIYGNSSNSFGTTSYEPNSASDLQALPTNTTSLSIDLNAANESNGNGNYSGYIQDVPWYTLSLPSSTINTYNDAYYQSYNNIFAFAKDLVAPGVIYRSVQVQNSVTKNGVTTNAPVYQTYEFQPFTTSMVQSKDIMPETTLAYSNDGSYGLGGGLVFDGATTLRTVNVINSMSQLGNLLSVKNYDQSGNLLSEKINTYTSTPPNNQGRIDQVFNEQRRMSPSTGDDNSLSDEFDFATVTVKTELPSVLQSTTTRDYVKGVNSTTTNNAFDFYSGAVTESQTTDSYGNTYITVTEPAYNYYTYYGTSSPGMGIKLINQISTWNNANMLSQVAASYSLKSTPSSVSGIPATMNYTCNVSSSPATSYSTEATVTITAGGILPMCYHIGSSMPGLQYNSNYHVTSNPLAPSACYITWISDDRTQFKVVGANNIGTGVLLSLNQCTVLSASANTWNNNWNYRMWTGTGYVYENIADNTTTVQYENVWRQKSDYVWNSPYVNSDGSFLNDGLSTGSYVPFAFSAEYNGNAQPTPARTPVTTPTFWSKLNTSTLFSYNSKPLENTDINGRYSSTKFCNFEHYILASASNAKYTEFTHSGAEYLEASQGSNFYAEGEVLLYGTQNDNYAYPTSLYAHTGKNSFQIEAGTYINYVVPYISGTGLPNGFTLSSTASSQTYNYRASVWVYGTSLANAQLYANVTDNGVTTSTGVTASQMTNLIKCGNWYLLTLTVPSPYTAASTTKIEVGVKNTVATGQTYIYVDDFRFQPDVSSVTSYVYDPNSGLLTYVLDANNRYTRYAYDTQNRLIGVYKETTYGEVTVKQFNYNYAVPITPCPPTQ
jgi:hypothetical protein